MRIGAIHHQHIRIRHHFCRDVGVQIEGGDNRNAGADNLTKCLQQCAFRIRLHFTDCAAMQRIVLHATSDRYPNDASVAQAVAQMWTRLNLKAEVETLPGSLFFSRASKQDFSAFAAQYGAEEAANSLRALVASAIPAKGFGTANRTRYSNAIVDQLLTDALQTMDDERRNQLLGRAIRFAMTDQPLIPVFYPIFDFAAKKGLVVTPRAQRRFNALMIRPVAK